ncbi:sgrR protein [Vibrio sp. JCM 19236]|nr:sgrR protein [Vibrio sp. JCM 19236]
MLRGWILEYSDVDLLCGDERYGQLQAMMEAWHGTPNQTFPAKELGRFLVENKLVIPMFHCWLGVSTDHCGSLQNAKCNALGWFDFSKVWVKPES